MSKGLTGNGQAGAMGRVRRQLEQWRGRSASRARIPEPLWAAAVDLARVHGIHRTSQALRLNYYSLKSRLEAASAPARQAAAPGPFIELPLGAAAGPACVIEVDDGRGARLRMELRGVTSGELSSLVGRVWERRR